MRWVPFLLVLMLAAPAEARDWAVEVAAIDAERPREFVEPVDYQRHVTRLVDWLVSVQPDLVGPRAELKRRKDVEAAKAREFGGPVAGANQRIAMVERDFGSPLWLAHGQVGTARAALALTLFPERDKLSGELDAVQDQARRARDQASAAVAAASSLDPKNLPGNKSTILAAATAAEEASRQVMSRAETLQVMVRRSASDWEIERATLELGAAVAAYGERKRKYDAAMGEPLQQLKAVKKVFDDRMAPFRSDVKQAEAALAAVEEPYLAGMRQYDALGTALGVLTEVNWKVFKRFDYKAFWAEQGKRLQARQ